MGSSTKTYILASIVAATITVWHAFASREQYVYSIQITHPFHSQIIPQTTDHSPVSPPPLVRFFPAMVYLASSKLSTAVIGNLGFALSLSMYKILTHIFLGTLRDSELERINDKISQAVVETLLAMTIFREDFTPSFVAMFVILSFTKVFHWLVQGRVDFVETTPNISLSQHFRLTAFAIFLIALDFTFLNFTLQKTIHDGVSVYLLFAFEYAVQATTIAAAMIKYAMSLVDLRLEGRWESKGVAVFYLKLTLDMCHLILYCTFFAVVFSAYGIPLHLVRDLYWTLRNFQHRVRDFLRFRRLTANMNAQFPDATVQDVERVGGVCIICREELAGASTVGTDSERDDGGEQEGQAARSAPTTTTTTTSPNTSTGGTNKKLACGHVFHLHCLRSWLERQQNCPICRATVTPAINVQEIHNGRHDRRRHHHHHQRHAGGGDRAAAAGNRNNHLDVNDGVLPPGGMRHTVRLERVPLENLVARIVDDEAEARRRSENGTNGQPSSVTTTTTTTTTTSGDGGRYTRGRAMPLLSPEQQQHMRALMQQQQQQTYNSRSANTATAIGTPPPPTAARPPSAAAQQAYIPPIMMMMMPSPSPTSPYLHHHNQPYPTTMMMMPSLPQQQPVTLEQHQAALAAATAAVHAARSATPSTTGGSGVSDVFPADTPLQFHNNNNNNNATPGSAAVTSTSAAHLASAEVVERLLEQQLSSIKSYLQRIRDQQQQQQQQQQQPSGSGLNEEGEETRKSFVNTMVGGGMMTSPSPPVAMAMVGGEKEQVGGSGSGSRSVRTTMMPSGNGCEEEKKKEEEGEEEEEEEEQGPKRVDSRPVCFSDESE